MSIMAQEYRLESQVTLKGEPERCKGNSCNRWLRKQRRARRKEGGGQKTPISTPCVCGQLGAPYRHLACGACNKSHGGLGFPARPKWALGPARQFSLTFERRELRLTPTSACSQVSFIERCGRSFRRRYRPTPLTSSRSGHGPRAHFSMGQRYTQFYLLKC